MTRRLTHFWRLAALACMCLGFQVHAERAALVTWWANPETDIAGYILCYGPAEQSFSKVIDVGNVTNVIVSDLIEGSTYYFAVKAYNTSGLQSELSEPVSLYVPTYTEVPKGAPVVGTRPPLSILATYAVLGGIINPRGESTAFWFEYGSDTNYGQVTAVQDLEGTNGMVLVKAVARWFEAGMTYHYRIVAFNKFGTNAGADWTFSTTILPPLLMISPVDGVISDRANLNAYVDPQGSDTIAWFEYGLDGQTNETEKVFIPGNGGMVPVNIRISKLQPESPYYFRLHATNQAGTVTSLDQSFLTGSPLAGRSVFLSWERGLNADNGG